MTKTKTQRDEFARIKIAEFIDGCGGNGRDNVVELLMELQAVCVDLMVTVEVGRLIDLR